ncbi:MAG: hypothetical protein H0V44_03745 [Planctomycetes bacterium]|nr:hypothetical protein [Planctomycetota bacterium]
MFRSPPMPMPMPMRMRMHRCLLVLLLSIATVLGAAALESQDVLAVSRFAAGGSGDPTAVGAGMPVAAGDRPALLTLADAPRSTIILAPRAEVHLQRVVTQAGTSLIIALDAGAIQVSIVDKGAYADIHVVGGALDVRVTGTLFVVERVKRDTDYVALVHGKLSVTLRQEIAEVIAAGATDHAELSAREGVEGGISGVGATDTLRSRPQLAVVAGGTASIEEKAASGEGGWDVDAAAAAIADAIAASGGEDGGVISPVISDEVFAEIASGIAEEILDRITGDIIDASLTPPFELGGPPGRP